MANERFAARWAAAVLWYATTQYAKGFISNAQLQRCEAVWASWPELND